MKDRLKEYIEKDEIYQDYKKDGLMNASDFDKFCIQHCKDIEELLEENKNLRSQIEYLRRSVERKEETIAELELERVPYTNEYVEELEKENSELKKQLEEANKKLYLCTPEIPRNVHGEYVSYVDLVNEIYELKKQLEDMTDCRDIASGHRKEVQDRETILLKQQQEFLKYLEDKIILCKNRPDYMVIGIHGSYDLSEIELNILEEILQKYLKIIGVSDK